MYELKECQYKLVLKLISMLDVPFAYAVIEKNQGGHVYVDNNVRPNCCLVVNNGGKYLVCGDEENIEFQ